MDSNEERRIVLHGEYDFTRRDEIAYEFGSITSGGPVVIDMTRVQYVDSTFLHALTALHFRFKEWGITLIGASPPIRRILQIMDFERLFEITDT